MKLSISKKFCKRSIKCLAMFAPLAYLFGSLFFGLNGAHNGFLFADSDVSYLDYSVSFYSGWVNPSNGELILGEYTDRWYSDFVPCDFESNPVSYFAHFEGSFNSTDSTVRTYFYKSDYSYISYRTYVPSSFDFEFYLVADCSFIRFAFAPLTYSPSGFVRFEWDTFPSPATPFDNSNYLFGQFFAKDNFLVQWGENAISDAPMGFAPFGTFIKYVDDNMLHLSDSQIGLMAYGYLYYTLHVLIAFFAFDILGFIPLFLQRVTDKIGGTEDD